MDGGLCPRPNDGTSWVSFISVVFDSGIDHHYRVGENRVGGLKYRAIAPKYRYPALAVI
jgi:hypothetical protein